MECQFLLTCSQVTKYNLSMTEERNRWITLIKDLRAEHNVSLSEAERIALSHPEWRRWVERQINTDSKCKRMAVRHIKDRGEDSLIEQSGGVLRAR